MKAGNEKESAKEIFAKLTKDYDENVKMPINEPANGKRKSQIQ